ncbi:MAG: YgaP family membrane protein [Halorubrum sp.]
MNENVGGYDRIARLVVGAVLVAAGIAGYAGMVRVAAGPVPQALMAVLLALIGTILLVTGYTQRCPINGVFGVDTFKPRGQ